ncbi:MAG TPA: DNA mismatch repair protein MutS [Ktedonobacterales bacterium]|nr:DNA mismatch repair protein MutS [Ktedonobacterales bacterium]
MGKWGARRISAHVDDHQAEREQSPVRQQYLSVKRQYPDAVLFFRMGDFYEMFDDDAELVARELDLTLTKRDFGRGQRSPMAGVPHHAADGYIARLIAKGYRVAVCEQVSDPALSRGLVEREVIRVVTPGTVIDPTMLVAKRNNFLAAAALGRDAVGVAYVDITTGEFACTQFPAADPEAALAQELTRVQPAEALIEAARPTRLPRPRARWRDAADDLAALDDANGFHGAAATHATEDDDDEPSDLASRLDALDARLDVVITPYDARHFREDIARERLLERFQVASLEAFGCEGAPLAIRAAGAIIAYLNETQRGALAQITGLETYSVSGFMTLDAHTRRNLELFESGRSGGAKGSLLSVLDLTRTPMGGRLLRRWLGEPLLDLPRLLERQEAVAAAKDDVALRARLAPPLSRAGDIERLINRALQRIATPRDLVALAAGLRAVEEVSVAMHSAPEGLARVCANVRPLPELQALIAAALVDDPPLTLADGGYMRPGYHAELDTLTDAARNGRQWVADLETKERERSGISNLRVGYNKVFGYYLEVTNSQLSRVPEDYIRKQTLSTSERFITPDLKEYEALILNAHEKSVKLEQELFSALRAEVAAQWGEATLRTARALAELDTLLALGEVASRRNYCRPTLDESDTIHIVAGRHPVVEATQRTVEFVPNDAEMATSEAQILLLTGPNMAGKSTYLRQVALITLMAQIGSFVPAESARIGLVDRIFTRIGAQDDLATGQSTFMVEMVETASILRHATPRSLIILDEIGRGTSTYDGLAIARAIVEYLHNNKRCGARTLFATHYHELVELARALPRVRAYNVAVTEEEGHIVFLRKIIPGGADKSYGIHVAQLAGIPRQVVRRAEEALEELERVGDAPRRRQRMREIAPPQAVQLTLFSAEPDPLIEDLKAIPIDELTPLEAISRLYELQRRARER